MWMELLKSFVELKGVKIRAFHGVMPQERQVGHMFTLDVRVGYPLASAANSDDVADTLNYAELYQLVVDEMAVPSCLIEHVAWRIAQSIHSHFPAATSADISIAKCSPPMCCVMDSASVSLSFKFS
jgi:dihydroneopterin aldolase